MCHPSVGTFFSISLQATSIRAPPVSPSRPASPCRCSGPPAGGLAGAPAGRWGAWEGQGQGQGRGQWWGMRVGWGKGEAGGSAVPGVADQFPGPRGAGTMGCVLPAVGGAAWGRLPFPGHGGRLQREGGSQRVGVGGPEGGRDIVSPCTHPHLTPAPDVWAPRGPPPVSWHWPLSRLIR